METPENIAQQYAIKCQELEDLKQAFQKQGEQKNTLQLRVQELEEANERLAAHNTDMEIECRRVLREATSIKEELQKEKNTLRLACSEIEDLRIELQGYKNKEESELETERVVVTQKWYNPYPSSEVSLSHITQGAGWYFKTGWKVPTIMISDIVITQHDDTGNPIKGYLLKPKQS